MNCTEFNQILDDYVDGALSGEALEAPENHLVQCAACAALVESTRELCLAAKHLSREVAPEVDLWPEIASRLYPRDNVKPFETQRKHPQTWTSLSRSALWQPLAAGLFMLLGAYFGVLYLDSANQTPVVGPGATVTAQEGGLLQAENAYRDARHELMQALDQRKDAFSPETLLTVEENLAVIDDAVKTVRAAVDADPQNQGLIELLLATRQKEVEFLQGMIHLPDQS